MKKNNLKMVVIGANGQVASEMILEIKKISPDIEIIPICRSRMGSLFLRTKNIQVVHASIENDSFPFELIKNADVVVNTIYVKANPAEAKKRHEAILKRIFMHTGSKTKIIHFSTVSVFQDSLYADEKLHQERIIKVLAKKYRRDATILRIGHVMGPNQGMSSLYLNFANSRNKIFLPNMGRNDANCVSVKYIAEIVLDISKKGFQDDGVPVYTAVFNPVVTWDQIFKLLRPDGIELHDFSPGRKSILKNMLNPLFNKIRNTKALHRLSLKIVWRLPLFVEKKIYARHLLSKAQQDITLLFVSQRIGQPPQVYLPTSPGERYPVFHKIIKEEILP